MELNRTWVEATRDGQMMKAFRMRPAHANGSLPGVIVIQEIWGPDDHIQDVTRRFAEAGYVALAPDLYSRGGRPTALSFERIEQAKNFFDRLPQDAWMNEEKRNQFLEQNFPPHEAELIKETVGRLFGPRDTEAMVADLNTWIEWLDAQTLGVVSVGYCMGGALSFALAATTSKLKAAVCNYGVAPTKEQMPSITCPVYGFYGGQDHRITDAVPEVAKEMDAVGREFRYEIYPQAGHAFFNDSRPSYDASAARDAWAKTLYVFNKVFS